MMPCMTTVPVPKSDEARVGRQNHRNTLQPTFVGVEKVWHTAVVPAVMMLHNTFCKHFDTL